MNVSHHNIPTTIAWVFLTLLLSACTSKSTHVGQQVPFEPVPVTFDHRWDHDTHPFYGAAVIDVNGDGAYEIFVGGGKGQKDGLFRYQDGKLVNIIQGTGLSNDSATYGMRAIDMDADGDTDIVVARDNGIWLYLNKNGSGSFQVRKIPVNLPKDSVPYDVTVGDIDNDGDGDLYVSAFVAFPSFKSATFNDPNHAKPNRLLMNNGDLTFTDITQSSGAASEENTFCSVFTDLDMDGWQDLVVAQNTGAVEIFRNKGDRTFEAMPSSPKFGFWMGLGIGDMDKDGDQDLFFPNVGSSIPEFLTKGDLIDGQEHTHEWMLLQNNGDFTFTDVTEAYKITGEGFAWGGVFEDLNMDGELDLFVAQNYIKWPFHKIFKLDARTYLQYEENGVRAFEHAPSLGLENTKYGQSSIIVDLDRDGRQDYLWINMNGPLRAFLNTSTENFITVVVPDTVANLGTRIYVETPKGRSYTREIVAGEGFMTDQSPERTFGLGSETRILRVVVERPDGSINIIPGPTINSRIHIN